MKYLLLAGLMSVVDQPSPIGNRSPAKPIECVAYKLNGVIYTDCVDRTKCVTWYNGKEVKTKCSKEMEG